MPMLDAVLAEAGKDWRDLTALGVGVGPGNFTGIRLAVAAARGLALGLRIPAVGVSVFEARAHGLPRPLTWPKMRGAARCMCKTSRRTGRSAVLDPADAWGSGPCPRCGQWRRDLGGAHGGHPAPPLSAGRGHRARGVRTAAQPPTAPPRPSTCAPPMPPPRQSARPLSCHDARPTGKPARALLHAAAAMGCAAPSRAFWPTRPVT
jgi:tRNA threonylcarbamoyladenosine biosynthesis protein TsaB